MGTKLEGQVSLMMRGRYPRAFVRKKSNRGGATGRQALVNINNKIRMSVCLCVCVCVCLSVCLTAIYFYTAIGGWTYYIWEEAEFICDEHCGY